jgi:hypothetical protein
MVEYGPPIKGGIPAKNNLSGTLASVETRSALRAGLKGTLEKSMVGIQITFSSRNIGNYPVQNLFDVLSIVKTCPIQNSSVNLRFFLTNKTKHSFVTVVQKSFFQNKTHLFFRPFAFSLFIS